MGNEFEIGQVHAPSTILFGNVKVYNAVKEGLKTDEKGNTIHCVWIDDVDNGVYAEYPTQKEEQVNTYTAREYGDKKINFITKETFESGKTFKDGKNYKFEVYKDYPTIFVEKAKDSYGSYYNGNVNGIDGIKYVGSKTAEDLVTFYNTPNADVIFDNDNKPDGINVSVDCGKITPHLTKGIDSMSVFTGYAEKSGYYNAFKKVF